MTLCETNKSSIFLWSESCQFTNYLLKIECRLTSESNDKNKMGDRRIGASSTTHVLQKTAIKFLSGVSEIKITYI